MLTAAGLLTEALTSRLGDQLVIIGTDVIARLGTGFDQSAVFEKAVGLHCRGHADLQLQRKIAQREDSVAGPKGALIYQPGNIIGDFFIKVDFIFVINPPDYTIACGLRPADTIMPFRDQYSFRKA